MSRDTNGRTSLRPGRCTTHHHACQCREAMHREVAEALDRLVFAAELPGDHCEIEQALPAAHAALKKYRRMYP